MGEVSELVSRAEIWRLLTVSANDSGVNLRVVFFLNGVTWGGESKLVDWDANTDCSLSLDSIRKELGIS